MSADEVYDWASARAFDDWAVKTDQEFVLAVAAQWHWNHLQPKQTLLNRLLTRHPYLLLDITGWTVAAGLVWAYLWVMTG